MDTLHARVAEAFERLEAVRCALLCFQDTLASRDFAWSEEAHERASEAVAGLAHCIEQLAADLAAAARIGGWHRAP
ncbi:MAG: hypothetical protein NZ761_07315 [Dehalococcoidia bacterium]|nr:hypothetical protein [Dehalococcoidia bacterium]